MPLNKLNNFWTGFVAAFAITLMLVIPQHCTDSSHYTEVTETVKNDTIPHFYDSPVPIDSAVIRYITIEVPVERYVEADYAEPTVIASSDTVAISLPIEQKVYEDSTYKAWVSGFQPALDSIYVYQPVTTKTITTTEYIKQTKRWGVGIQAGVGITPNRIEPYIGIGVTYNIFSW